MGKKTLEEMLRECTVKPGIKDATRRLATFLAYWEEIEEAYRKGWSWLQIYNALFQGGVIDYSYSTFLYYKDKKRRREIETAKPDPRTRSIGEAKEGAVDRPARAPGSARNELPVFEDALKQREAKRF